MKEEFWQLSVALEGQTFKICGSREVLEASMDEAIEALNAVDGVGAKTIIINGFCDSADRAEHRLMVCPEQIQAISMFKVY